MYRFIPQLGCILVTTFQKSKSSNGREYRAHPMFIEDEPFLSIIPMVKFEVSDMDEMRKMNPNTSFIFIYHTTKEGKFRGVNAHAHEVDVIIEVEKGKATSTGRFNAGGSVGVN
ncbi:MAG: hypothetical protein ACKOXP_04875 [Flavobacteriales bacterium]